MQAAPITKPFKQPGDSSKVRSCAAHLADIAKIYQDASGLPHTALANVDLRIEENEFFTLLGPAGCGKTTLLRLIGGFEQPSRGSVSV